MFEFEIELKQAATNLGIKMKDVVGEVLQEERRHEITQLSSDNKEFEYFCKIYDRVNSSNDEIKKQYNHNLLIKFSDIQELHQKVIQAIKSLNAVFFGLNAYISLNGGESEKFKSFEDLESYKITSPKPTNNIFYCI